MIVAPSLLASDFLNLEKEIKRINESTCQWLHLDVMDGQFVDDITFGYPLIEKISHICTKKLDVHLMVEKPQKLAQKLMELPIYNLTIHVEILENVNFEDLLNFANEKKVNLGLALNPDTQIENYKNYINKVNYILLMSVYPGKGGQQFIEEILLKEKEIRALENGNNAIINIDGGINDKSIKKVKATSINAVVAGSFIFKENIQKQVDLLK